MLPLSSSADTSILVAPFIRLNSSKKRGRGSSVGNSVNAQCVTRHCGEEEVGWPSQSLKGEVNADDERELHLDS